MKMSKKVLMSLVTSLEGTDTITLTSIQPSVNNEMPCACTPMAHAFVDNVALVRGKMQDAARVKAYPQQ